MMRLICLFCSIFAGLVISPATFGASKNAHHREGHPNAAQIVPPEWRLQRPDPKWQGRRYISPDGSSWFTAYSTPANGATSQVDAMASQPGERITYQRREPDWGAISGYKDDKIFYRKAVLACGRRVWHHLAFEYPASRKREMDAFVIRASRSIDRAENESCVDRMDAKRRR